MRPFYLDDISTCGNVASGFIDSAGFRLWWRRRGRLLITHWSILSSEERDGTLFPIISSIPATGSHLCELRGV